jgi:transcriptional regulator with XRE-family HTH domain
MPRDERERKVKQARGTAIVRSLHLRGLSDAGAARAAALTEAEQQLDRIARLLHDALDGGVLMSEIARATGVSRQTLYELKGRYGNTQDLRLAVLQALATGYEVSAEQLADHLGRPVEEVSSVLADLRKEGLADWDFSVVFDGTPGQEITAAGLQALEGWTFEDETYQEGDHE